MVRAWMTRSMAPLFVVCVLTSGVVLAAPDRAEAQWYVGAYLGGNYTHPADVTIDQPAEGRALTFHDVHFDAKPLASPQYYGYRFGRMFGSARRFGVEVELIHLKVISRTADSYLITGRSGGATVDGVLPMDTYAQRYAMTHGLNFILANVVWRTPIRGPFAFVARGGAGPTLPHAETAIDGVSREQYEYGGMGAHAAAGIDLRLHHNWSAIAEYKLTAAHPEISIPSGTGETSALTHQVAFGLAFGRAR